MGPADDVHGLHDLDDLDDLDLPEPADGPDDGADGADGAGARGPSRRPRRRRGSRRTAVAVVGGAALLAGAVAVLSPLLRSPQERVEARLTDALEGAGARLQGPVALEPSDGSTPVWSGRVSVVQEDGSTSGVRVALRLHGAAEPGAGPATDPATDPAARAAALFPLVDCASRYPLSWVGDSDTSFRTTRSDLAECRADGGDDGEVLVTIAWDGGGQGTVGRQTWRTDASGGVVWLHNGGAQDGSGGLTGEQQRVVATTEGLLDPP